MKGRFWSGAVSVLTFSCGLTVACGGSRDSKRGSDGSRPAEGAVVPVWQGKIEHPPEISAREEEAVAAIMKRLYSAMPPGTTFQPAVTYVRMVSAPDQFRFSSSNGEIHVGWQGVHALLDETEDSVFGPPQERKSALAFAFAHELGHLAGVGSGGNHAQIERAVDDFAISVTNRAGYSAGPGIVGTMAMLYMINVRHGGSEMEILDNVISFADLQLRVFNFDPQTTRQHLCEALALIPKGAASEQETLFHAIEVLVDEPVPQAEQSRAGEPPPSIAESLARAAEIHAAYPIECSDLKTR